MTGSAGGDFLLLLGILVLILWALGSMMDPPPPISPHHWKDWKEPIISDAEDEEAPPEWPEDPKAQGQEPPGQPRDPSRLEAGSHFPPPL